MAISSLASPLAAQTTPDGATIAQTVTRDTLLAAPSGRLEDALAGVAGLTGYTRADSTASNPAQQGLTTRGLGGNSASRTVVTLDGVPMSDPFFGYVPWSALAVETLGAAQITRGGTLTPGAVAGTLALTSADPARAGLINAQALGSAQGSSQTVLTLSPHIGQGYATTDAHWDRGGDFWTTPATQRGPDSIRATYESWSASSHMVMPVGPLVLDGQFLGYADNRSTDLAGDDSLSRALTAVLGLSHKRAWTWSARGYWQSWNYETQAVSPITGRRIAADYATPSHTSGAQFRIAPPVFGGQHLTLGADMRDLSGEADDMGFNLTTGKRNLWRWAGGRTRDDGIYAKDTWSTGRLSLNAGARADYWSLDQGFIRQATGGGTVTLNQLIPARHGWQSSLDAGAALALGGGVALRGAAYASFRLPSLNELYHPALQPAGPAYPTITTLANTSLAPERLTGFDGGFDWRPTPGTRLAVTLFADRLAHAIIDVPTLTTATAITYQRQNITAIRSRGIEADAQATRGPLTFTGSLSYADAQVEADGLGAAVNGQRPARTPALAGQLSVQWHASSQLSLGGALNHTGPAYEDAPAQDRLSPATTLDLWASWALGRGVSLVLRGQNVTDAALVTRNLAGAQELAAPRTLWAGLRVALR